MATWEDGPEYAPFERPDGFAAPDASPLSPVGPAPDSVGPAPAEHPRFDRPSEPTVALHAVGPARTEDRDPTSPFAVAASTVTSSAWGAAHGGGPAALVAAAAPVPVGPGPTGPWPQGASPAAPWAPPSWPPPPSPGSGPYGSPGSPPVVGPYPTDPSGFPAPGTPGWFTPAPPPAPPHSTRVTTREVVAALTPGLLICLGVGGLIPAAAPVTLALAAALSGRVQVARSQVRTAMGLGIAALALLAFVTGVASDTFGEWWGRLGWFALLGCWTLGVTLAVVAYHALRRRPGPPETWR